MRISDWSSDVCSSDLSANTAVRAVCVRGEGKHFCTGGDVRAFSEILELGTAERRADFKGRLDRVNALVLAYSELEVPVRSEEHTSELQSLMRISYAVFCLKKKK